jgi:hypothetical protein
MNDDLQRLHHAIAYTLRGLDSSQTQLRPVKRPDGWSIQQIVEHLLLTYSSTETTIASRLKKRRPTRTKPGLLQHFSQYTVIRLGYFPHGRKAPAIVTPRGTSVPLSGEELTQMARQHLVRLHELFKEAEEVFGPFRCASHHVLGPLSIDQWRRFHLVHGEHHARQILAIRKAHGVPVSALKE